MNRMQIREEREDDASAVYAVNAAAFETSAEAALVDLLRRQARPVVSLVAEVDGSIVGHIMFSPAALTGPEQCRLMALGPMAVSPRCQRRGIGSALVHAGLDRCRALGFDAVVVLGHPAFYPRFGFQPASRFDLRCEYDAPDDAFMTIELVAGALEGKSGVAKYHSAFSQV